MGKKLLSLFDTGVDEEAVDIVSQQWNKMVINGECIDVSGTKNIFNLIKVLKHWSMVHFWLCMPQCAQTKFQIMSQRWNACMELKDCLDLKCMMKLFKHITSCIHWMATNYGVWFMGEHEEAIGSCSKLKHWLFLSTRNFTPGLL